MTHGTTDQPRRIQRKRTKGWRMPENTVYVGRPGQWGNPYASGDRLVDVDLFYERFFGHKQHAVAARSNRWFVKEQLKGKNLACWCPLDQPCHADVLLEIANAGETE